MRTPNALRKGRRHGSRVGPGPALAPAWPNGSRLRVVRDLDVSYETLSRALHTNLTSLLHRSAPGRDDLGPEVIGLTSALSGPLRIPAVVEIESTGHVGSIHIRWRARHLRSAFPVMEAELTARARPDGHSQLVLTGEYTPPFGSMGAVVDLLVGRHVAHSTGERLLASVARTLASAPDRTRTAVVPAGPDVRTAGSVPVRDHEALLTMARRVRAAAQDRDWERFSAEARRFRAVLEAHIESEAHDLSRLPDPERHRLEVGQDELLGLAAGLVGLPGELPGTSLSVPASRLVASLAYQREQERRALANAA